MKLSDSVLLPLVFITLLASACQSKDPTPAAKPQAPVTTNEAKTPTGAAPELTEPPADTPAVAQPQPEDPPLAQPDVVEPVEQAVPSLSAEALTALSVAAGTLVQQVKSWQSGPCPSARTSPGAAAAPICAEALGLPSTVQLLAGELFDLGEREALDELVAVHPEDGLQVFAYDWSAKKLVEVLSLPVPKLQECTPASFVDAYGVIALPSLSGGAALVLGPQSAVLRFRDGKWCQTQQLEQFAPTAVELSEESAGELDVDGDGTLDQVEVKLEGESSDVALLSLRLGGQEPALQSRLEVGMTYSDTGMRIVPMGAWLDGVSSFVFQLDSVHEGYGIEHDFATERIMVLRDGQLSPLFSIESSRSAEFPEDDGGGASEGSESRTKRSLIFARLGKSSLILKQTLDTVRGSEGFSGRWSRQWLWVVGGALLDVDANRYEERLDEAAWRQRFGEP
ncbi:MAG: hypothetical protein RBU37_25445 [Myxococcota bacterium]|jgi:hypothetical protein|nr:hypothetical protein [Myxococcota bacterium]